MAQSNNRYVAPITLGFTPSDGDIIEGTINDVKVRGELFKGEARLRNALDELICSIGLLDGRAVVMVEQKSAPTTDYELHLYRYVPAGIVKIPKEYVEGLEEGMIINSSTPNSTKKFKITVDDTGAITATEVTT